MIYNLHLFDGEGNCLFSLSPPEDTSDNSTRLLYGFLYSLKSFSMRISPTLNKDNSFFTYTTSTYQLVFMEMPTSLKMVLIIEANNGKSNEYFKQCLRDFYRTVYVEYVVRNPLICQKGQPIESSLFREKANEFINKI